MGKFLRRLSALLHRRRLKRELAEEMAAHREMMPPERRRNFGSPLHFQEQTADHWGWTFLDHLRQDLVFAARQLRRSPSFTFTAIAVLALGIGVNLAEAHIFVAFLHRLNVRDVDSLCAFYRVTPQRMTGAFSVQEIEFYRRNTTVLSAVIAQTDGRNICQSPDSAEFRCILVSGNFFETLGIAPLYGRLLNGQDDQPGSPPVAILGYDYWQSRFGGDPRIVMQTIRLNDKPLQVVGIGPPTFGGLGWHAQAWVALSQYPYLSGVNLAVDHATRLTAMYGRLKPGISREAAEAEFRSLTAALRRQQPQYIDPNEWLKLQPVDLPLDSSPRTVLLISTFVLLVLLVLFSACANLGNMLLARGLARQREIDIRLALGAGRWRVVRQLMTENLLLAAVSSVAALLVGRLAALLVLRLAAAPSDLRIVTDWRIVLAGAALGLGATLAFGLAPAIQIVKGAPRATRARRVLVAVQVTASCVLLILSSFLMNAIQQSLHTGAALDYSQIAAVDPAFYRHDYSSSEARQSALEIAVRLRRLPGIEAASVAAFPPLLRARLLHASGLQLCVNEVDTSYFPMMRLSLLLGRIFGPADLDAVVIGESAARKLWPNQPPLGKSILLAQRPRTVIGVVQDSGLNLIDYPESVEAYLPISDRYAPFSTVLVRVAGNPAPMAAALQSAASVSGIHPLVFTYQSLIDLHFQPLLKVVRVVSCLAAVASLLALVGLFGLLAFTVAQRTREIGVRMALGARGPDILRVVLGQYALPMGVGGLSGVVLAAVSATVLRKTVFGFMPFEVLSFGSGLLLFAIVALAASIAPARRALRIDPASALRYE